MFAVLFASRPWNRNAPMRVSDRVDGLVRLVAAAAVLCAVPLSGVFGVAEYRSATARMHAESAGKAEVPAVLTDTPKLVPVPPAMSSDTVPNRYRATAHWVYDGHAGETTIEVSRTARRGDQVPVWLGPDGRPTRAPVDRSAADQAIGAGLAVLVGTTGAAGVIVVATRWMLGRRRAGTAADRSTDRAGRAMTGPAAVCSATAGR
ncbi:hypothetical protein [Nocardia sp. BMG51109]|uniref:Rv1733c family protein n=1 Tax=Nocardia sp. BMG51109 TaxID=1056816 RepID=UPI0004B1908B|nr:hypothetical protein [Nocardia sp. BMG51109]